jgi:soluble lytic murein transglycosylase
MGRASCGSIIAIVVGVGLGSCSGDDGHGKHSTLPPPVAAGTGSAVGAGTDADAVAPSTAAPPGTAALTEEMATPFFTEGEAKLGAERFALEDWAGARTHFAAARAALPATATAAEAAHLDLVIALCDAATSKWKEAAAGFASARAALPVIADWISYQEARALYFAHDTTEALARARAVAADSIVGPDAELLVGDLLRAGKDHAATAAHYRDYLARRPDGIRRSEARYRLAEALEAGKKPADLPEIVASYRAIGLEDPLSSWATKAKARTDKLGPKLPDDLAATLTTFTAAELIGRGKVEFDGMRNPLSEATFTAVLALPSVTPDEACVAAYHQAQSRFKARDRKGAAPMFDAAIEKCHAAGNKDLEVRTAYQAGRSYAFNGDHDTAIARYEAAEAADPTHTIADDALLRQAEEWADKGNDKKVRAALSALPDKYPNGDMRAEALWRLGWRAWRKDDYAEAIDWWKKQIAAVPIDDNYWAEGEPQYWIGRALAAQGKDAAALDAWEDAARTYPMAYYALLALNRIREAAPKRFEKLVGELAADPAGYDPKAPVFQFKPRPEWAAPGFARAMELMRLGLGEPAEHELRVLGLVPPKDKKKVTDTDLAEKLWALAFLYDRAGRYATSHWPTRWHILDYRRAWAAGANKARWEIAYPKAFWDLLTTHAQKNDVPVAMQIAIVREESAFDPLMESYANAIGLTQMIPVTGERFARGTGLTADRETLRDPEKNVTIGSRFLGYVHQYWKKFLLLVPPSYNAGEGGVRKMLRARGTWDADEFIEGIVDDQARNYSKRVLGTFFTYTWLYEGTVPEIPNKIPTDLIPKK